MDLFDWSQRKKQKIGEHEEAHSEEGEDGSQKKGKMASKRLKPGLTRTRKSHGDWIKSLCIGQRLKRWGLDKEFTVHGGSRLQCITCMKYGAWQEQEGADMKKKKKKQKVVKKKILKKKKEKPLLTEEVRSPGKSHGPAEADSSDDETTHADKHALQTGTYEPPPHMSSFHLKFVLKRHLTSPYHKKAAGAREEDEHVNDQDVPTAAQMRFVYEDVKKSPMVLPSPIA